MTLDQIDQMVRKANPVPDLSVLEPVDASVLVLDQQRRTEMQTHDRVEVDQVPQDPRRNLFIGIAAVAAIVVGVLVFLRPLDDAPVAADQPVGVATAFMDAYAALDADRVVSFLDADAFSGAFDQSADELRLEINHWKAQGYKLLLDSCEELNTSPVGTLVRCTYDYHAIRSDEIGLGPYNGSWFDIGVLEDKIVSLSGDFEFIANGFSAQMWEPFAAWVAEAHPDDVIKMYTDDSQTMQRMTEDANQLWDQRSREYVEVARSRAEAEAIAIAFVEAYSAFDVDTAASNLADDADLELDGALTLEDLRLTSRFSEAQGFKRMFDTCEGQETSPSGTLVRCTYDFHGIRSEEIGLGPYSGSWFDVTVHEGKIVSVSDHIRFMSNGFDSEMWGPFADWVAETYPDDVTIMYTDARQTMNQLTEESIALWEQRTREYVEVAKG